MNTEQALNLTFCRKNERGIIEGYISQKSLKGKKLEILEAGCGQFWPLELTDVNYQLTGLDLDEEALRIRKETQKDLDKTILGDLRTAELEENKYDIIYSSFVLEHISGAEKVMDNFKRWLKPAGIIILKIPDPNSVQGFVTRYTPHWFHILYYRWILNSKHAGQKGHPPYPVHYDPIISLPGVHYFCKKNNINILAEFGDGYHNPGKGIIKIMIRIFKKMISWLSLGKLSSRHTNLLFILQVSE